MPSAQIQYPPDVDEKLKHYCKKIELTKNDAIVKLFTTALNVWHTKYGPKTNNNGGDIDEDLQRLI